MKVEWMKPRIKSIMWNIRKQKTANQNNKKKKESKNKNEDSVRSLWNNFNTYQHLYCRGARGEEKEQEIGNLFLKSSERKLP